MTFPERITAIRKEMKLSQEKFGELAGVSQRTVAFWESGDRMPSFSVLSDLATKLNVTIDYLLCRTDIKTKPKEKQPADFNDRLRADIISQVQTLPDPALQRVSDFLAGIKARQEVASAQATDPDPADKHTV